MNKQFRKNVLKALHEYKYSKFTEAQVAKRNHISRRTLYKYKYKNNITRNHSLYKSPSKPAKKISKRSKRQRRLRILHHQAIEYIHDAPREDVDIFLKQVINMSVIRYKYLKRIFSLMNN